MEGAQLGLSLRDSALDRMERRDWVQQARVAAKALLATNGNQPVTIDDVHDLVGEPERPNENGAVFRKGFVLVGYVPSAKPSSHGRKIGMWQLA